ncbi:MAG: PHP domain-containing protein [Spirochaetota bacterium]|nr:PHP domain-containing protein [Spirochaetota bacterium]
MAYRIDLHIHSHYSEDGDYSVDYLFELAAKKGLSAISITDHDSIESIPDALKASNIYGVEYIPGVELTTIYDDGSQQHILGYYIHDNPQLNATLKQIGLFRWEIAKKRIKKLQEIGFSMNEDNVWQKANNRPPTATAIMLEVFENPENRNDKRLQEYFEGKKSDNRLMFFYREYLSENMTAYVPFKSIPTKEGIDVITSSGGIPVLAHPKFVNGEEHLRNIVSMGIMGIEAISSYHTKQEIAFFQEFAATHNLIVTAGSDFHGPTSKPKVSLGGIEGNDYRLLEELKKLHDTYN